MRLLFLAAAFIGVGGSGALAADVSPIRDMPTFNPNEGSAKSCPPTSRYEAARRGGKLPGIILNELPAADLYNAVYRRIGGCNAPIIIGYDIGALPERKSGRR
jgi:hypothetical protein